MGASASDVRIRLARITSRVPEVMVKVTGRTRDPGHLRAHLDYISRNGGLTLETAGDGSIEGRLEVAALAADWAAEQLCDPSTRSTAPFSHSIVLSMPAGTDPFALRDAARAFAADMFAGSHDYVFALHTDTPRPHIHLSVCSRGHNGERLNPKKADLEAWRQAFAQTLRDRGVQAEATPRRARGVTRKAERTPIRKIRERHEAGQGGPGRTRVSAYKDAAKAAFQNDTAARPWEARSARRQALIRGLYLAQAQILAASGSRDDQRLAAVVRAFVEAMPQPDSQRLALARELRAANAAVDRRPDGEGRQRGR